AYGLVVLTQGHFSALAGGVALAIMMVPTITRTTEEMLLLVPQAVREAAYGLGVSQWRTTVFITLRTATSGVITGVMLAFARVAGETAPLLFTAFGNQFWNFKLNQPTAALPLQIFVYAISPFDEWHRQAWPGAHRRDRNLRQRQLAGGNSPPHRYGVSETQSLSHHVHLRQRSRRPEAQRLSQSPRLGRNRRALA